MSVKASTRYGRRGVCHVPNTRNLVCGNKRLMGFLMHVYLHGRVGCILVMHKGGDVIITWSWWRSGRLCGLIINFQILLVRHSMHNKGVKWKLPARVVVGNDDDDEGATSLVVRNGNSLSSK
ncbi:unnamed protein product [Linum trigynum]|uniref:Uncharacterized protein n=1 Tax=Linum trigynum TaxID=586398 RepID=A0AAV2DSV9_9ROSI